MNPNVLVVPGIGGNDLFIVQSLLTTPLRVWLEYGPLIFGGWRLLQLDPTGRFPAIPGAPALAGFNALTAFYGDLFFRLKSAGLNPISAAIDWRMQLVENLDRVEDQLSDLSSEGPVSVICHSRGGLVMRRCLARLPESLRAQFVGRVVCCGTPHYGSWASPPFLGARDPFMQAVTFLLGVTDPFRPVGALLPSVHAVMCSWPSLYELMPAPGAPGVDPATIAPLYLRATWAPISGDVSAHWLTAALFNWSTMPAVPADVSWLDVYGEGVETATALRTVSAPQYASSYDYTAGGDGVVPSAWAVQPGRPRIRLGGVSHQGLMQTKDSLDVIMTYLNPAVPLPAPL